MQFNSFPDIHIPCMHTVKLHILAQIITPPGEASDAAGEAEVDTVDGFSVFPPPWTTSPALRSDSNLEI